MPIQSFFRLQRERNERKAAAIQRSKQRQAEHGYFQAKKLSNVQEKVRSDGMWSLSLQISFTTIRIAVGTPARMQIMLKLTAFSPAASPFRAKPVDVGFDLSERTRRRRVVTLNERRGGSRGGVDRKSPWPQSICPMKYNELPRGKERDITNA